MIAFLNGVLQGKSADSIVVDCNGVGFAVGMSANSISKMPDVGRSVLVHTHLQTREDSMQLFGFASLEEKSLFERLISVSGVGPKVALAALSAFDAKTLASAIMEGDAALVSKTPGVGKKTAQRIILELKGTLEHLSEAPSAPLATNATEAIMEDLLAMGFTSAEVELACKGVPEGLDEAHGLQYALRRLGA